MKRLTVWADSPLGCSCWELVETGHMECREVCDIQAACKDCPINRAIDKLAEYENIDPDPGRILFHISYNSLWIGYMAGVLLSCLIHFLITHLI